MHEHRYLYRITSSAVLMSILGVAAALTIVLVAPGEGAEPAGKWTDLNPDSTVQFTTEQLNGVDFVDGSAGVIVGRSGTIFHTTDRGTTWLAANTGTSESLHGVDYIDTSHATAVGDRSTILRSNDGGVTWIPQDSGVEPDLCHDLFDVFFVNELTGWAVGACGTILKTKDGGLAWDDQSVATDQSFFAAWFFDAWKGFAASSNGIIWVTTDGGMSWKQNATGQLCGGHWSGLCNVFRGIAFRDESVGFVVGYPSDAVVLVGGSFRKTVDGGISWFEPPSSISGFDLMGFEAIVFGNATDGMLLATAGPSYWTDNGGETWVEMVTPRPGYAAALCFGDANTVYAVGAMGTIWRWDRATPTPVENRSWGAIKSIYGE